MLPVHHHPVELARIFRGISPRDGDDVQIVLLTRGIYNSAYFEHSFLAQQMGVELVQERDLIVDGVVVYLKTIRGPDSRGFGRGVHGSELLAGREQQGYLGSDGRGLAC